MLQTPVTPPTTSSPSGLRNARVTILNVMADGQGAAFALTDDTCERVFISARAVAVHGLKAGQVWDAVLAPNEIMPDKTPWFSRNLRPVEGALENDLVERVLAVLLDEGSAWTAHRMALRLDCTTNEADGALEVIYGRDTRIAKVVLFRATQQKGSRIWFTAVPDRIDVDEFEEEAE